MPADGTRPDDVVPAVAGLMTAQCVATGKVPDLVRPFALDRFYEDRLVGEKAAAAVSH